MAPKISYNHDDTANQEQESNQLSHSAKTEDQICVPCTNCGKEYRISNSNLGRKFTCTECGSECFASGNELGSETLTETTKDCPYCGEEILKKAKKCKHCGEFLNQNAEAIENQDQPPAQQNVTDVSAQTPKTAPVNSAYCLSCGNVVSSDAAICPSCGIKLQGKKESGVSTGLLVAGWLGVAFFPILGLIVGIICCSKRRVGSGVAMIVLSIITVISILIGIEIFNTIAVYGI